MRSSHIPHTLRASTCAAVLLFACTSCVSAQSPTSSSTTTTTSHSTTTPSPSDHIDPNSISTGNSGLSNGAVAALSACGGFVFVFCIAATLFIWNRRATRDMPDVQELVLSDGDDAGRQQRAIMAGPLSTLTPSLTPPEPVYRPCSGGSGMMRKKGSYASDDYYDLEEKGLGGLRVGLRQGSGRDWAEALEGDEEAVLQAAVARVVSGKSY
ncbi:Acid protease [Lasiodiplodia theobromae]|uniref:Acid protease n=1 Tax=Lasiodiplodia theobromae TaxID=45133 RepID=UPI0015C3F13D|nr:Acid protease [Lasiodiplodia theobromae]KAF4540610.1 Acid protease [Lasiodiplodia theobromae]